MSAAVQEKSFRYAFKTQPWKHQFEAFDIAVRRPASMLAFRMRLGKSKTAIDLINAWDADPVLVFGPISATKVWPSQFAEHSLADYDVCLLNSGSVAKRAEQAQFALDVARAKGRRVAIVVNGDAVWRSEFGRLVKKVRWGAIVGDEIHRAKSPKGKLSKFLSEIPRRGEYRLGLTGTPMPHSPLDLWAQFRFLDESVFGRNFSTFKVRYVAQLIEIIPAGPVIIVNCPRKWDGFFKGVPGAVFGADIGAWRFPNTRYVMQRLHTIRSGIPAAHIVTGYRNQEELNANFYKLAIRVLEKDAFDVPEEMLVDRECDLSPRERRVYDGLEDDFYARVGAGEITASNALTQLLRLQQATSGYAKLDDGSQVGIGTSKADLLADVLEDLEPPVVVFCRFIHDLDAVRGVAEKLGLVYHELSGRRKDLTEDAKMLPETQVLGCQIQAGGVGVDLSRASTDIDYSIGFNYGDWDQAHARIKKPHDRLHKTTTVFLRAANTLDSKLYKAIQAKKDLIEVCLKRSED